METALREQDAVVELGPDWSHFVVRDGNLITGQSPQSSHDVTAAAVNALAE